MKNYYLGSFAVLLLVSIEVGYASSSQQDGWELIDDSDRIQVFEKKEKDSDLIAFKGIGEIDQSMFKVIAAMEGYGPHPRNWADQTTATLLEKIPPFDNIIYLALSTPFVIKDREFVIRSSVTIDPQNSMYTKVIQSVDDHPKAPKNTGRIRGVIKKSSFILQPMDQGKRTRIVTEIFSDPMGTVPKWLINMVQKGWPRNTINNLREAASDPDAVEHSEIKAIFEKAK